MTVSVAAGASGSIFVVPVLYVLLTRWSYGAKELAWLKGHHEELAEKARRVESQIIDPELEYEIELANKEHTEFRRQNGF